MEIKLLNGGIGRHLPTNSFMLNLWIGDSNAVGWDAAHTVSLNQWPAGTPDADTPDYVLAGSSPYGVHRQIYQNGWDTSAALNSLDATVGRNQGIAANGQGTVSADCGFDGGGVGAGLAVSPVWAAAAEMSHRYERHHVRHVKGAGFGDGFFRTGNGSFGGWVIMGGSGASFSDGGGGVTSFHPDATAAVPLYPNLETNIQSIRETGGGAGITQTYFDCAYVVMSSADGQSTAGYEEAPWAIIGNIRALQRRLGDNLGITHPPMLIALPMAGDTASWTSERVGILRDQIERGRERGQFPNIRFVDIDDIERAADGVHFTAEGYVTLGARMAAARSGWDTPLVEIEQL